jgi:hypothetical protein
VDLPLNTALPKDRARSACTAALRTQVALRLSRFDLEVFFLGAAIISTRVFEHSLSFYLLFVLDASQEAIKTKMVLNSKIGKSMLPGRSRNVSVKRIEDLNIHYFSGSDCNCLILFSSKPTMN